MGGFSGSTQHVAVSSERALAALSWRDVSLRLGGDVLTDGLGDGGEGRIMLVYTSSGVQYTEIGWMNVQ